MNGSPVAGSRTIVTGGAVGVGRVIAEVLARQGASVTVCDIRADVEDAAAALRADGLDVSSVVADVVVPADVRRVVDGVVARSGGVDLLVSNAGVVAASEPTDDWEKALADYEHVIGVNLKGPYLFGRAVAPLMVAQGSGNIVNVATDHTTTCGWPRPHAHQLGSTCPWAAAPRTPSWVGMDVYDASKWGLNGLTLNWARALRPHGVRVNNLCIGATDSHMMRGYAGFLDTEPPQALLDKWIDPAEVGRIVVELVAEGPQGRSGDNVGIWIGHPVELRDPDPMFNVPLGLTPEAYMAPLFAYMA